MVGSYQRLYAWETRLLSQKFIYTENLPVNCCNIPNVTLKWSAMEANSSSAPCHLAFTPWLLVHVVSAVECGYLGDKVLVTRVVRGDDGEDVPVVFLHDV